MAISIMIENNQYRNNNGVSISIIENNHQSESHRKLAKRKHQ
jgi:hypothetical protein